MLLTSDAIVDHVDYVPILHEALPGLAETGRSSQAPALRDVVLLGERRAPGTRSGAELEALAASVTDEDVARATRDVGGGRPGARAHDLGHDCAPKGLRPHARRHRPRLTGGRGARARHRGRRVLGSPAALPHVRAAAAPLRPRPRRPLPLPDALHGRRGSRADPRGGADDDQVDVPAGDARARRPSGVRVDRHVADQARPARRAAGHAAPCAARLPARGGPGRLRALRGGRLRRRQRPRRGRRDTAHDRGPAVPRDRDPRGRPGLGRDVRAGGAGRAARARVHALPRLPRRPGADGGGPGRRRLAPHRRPRHGRRRGPRRLPRPDQGDDPRRRRERRPGRDRGARLDPSRRPPRPGRRRARTSGSRRCPPSSSS